MAQSGKLYLVPTPIGNLEDITLRALKVLSEAALVLAEDTRVSSRLMSHYSITTRLSAHHKFNEHATVDKIASMIEGGESVALISDAGTPGISDPGFLLTRTCLERGLQVECLPGATAFVPALVESGLPSDRFIFEGFLPQKKGRQKRLLALAEEHRTILFYESPHRVVKLLTELKEIFGADRPCSVSREISKLYGETVRGSVQKLLTHFSEKSPRGEFVVVVGGWQRGHEDNAVLPETE